MDHICGEVHSKWASERGFLWKKTKYKKQWMKHKKSERSRRGRMRSDITKYGKIR
jgi:hypothetical protein